MAMLRMGGRDVHSNYGPTADTRGLVRDQAPTIYAYCYLAPLGSPSPNGLRRSVGPVSDVSADLSGHITSDAEIDRDLKRILPRAVDRGVESAIDPSTNCALRSPTNLAAIWPARSKGVVES